MFTACGGQPDVGGAAGSLSQGGRVSAGGSTGSIGGNTSYSTGATGGSVAASTGHSTAIDLNTYCSGLLANYRCNPPPNMLVTSCDIPIPGSPPIPAFDGVLLDCVAVPRAFPDAGILDGYYIDYNQSPPRLELTGVFCKDISTNGIHSLVAIPGCRG